MKICSNCKQTKPFDRFSPNRRTTSGYNSWCKDCVNESQTAKRQSGQERVCGRCGLTKNGDQFNRHPTYCRDCKANVDRITRYGLDEQAYAELLDSQGGVCAICRRDLPLQIDHDHACCDTNGGKSTCGRCVRGLLCRQCNKMLPFLEKNRDLLLKAAQYLSKTS